MKNIYKTLALLSIITVLVSCKDDASEKQSQVTSPPVRYISDALAGKHVLHKVSYREDNHKTSQWNMDGGFFLFMGSVSGSGSSEEKVLKSVVISWELKDSSFAITPLPVEKVRIKLDSGIKERYVTFEYVNAYYCEGCEEDIYNHTTMKGYPLIRYPSVQDMIGNNLVNAVIHCRPEDWTPNISMNKLGN